MSLDLPPGALSAGHYANGIRCAFCADGFHKKSSHRFVPKGAPSPEGAPNVPKETLVCRNCGGRSWYSDVSGRRINVFVWWHPGTWFAKRSWQWLNHPVFPPPPPPNDKGGEYEEPPGPTPAASLPSNSPDWLKVE